MILSIRVVLVAMFTLFIIITASLTLGITTPLTRASTKSVGISYAESLASKTQQQFESFIEQPTKQLQALQTLGKLFAFALPSDIPDWTGFERWAVNAQKVSGFMFMFALIGFEDGYYCHASTGAGPANTFQLATVNASQRAITNKSVTWTADYNVDNYTLVSETRNPTTYDPRLRPYYSAPRVLGSCTWMAPQLSVNPIDVSVGVSGPLHNSSGYFIGMAFISFSLRLLSDELLSTSFRPTPNTYSAVVGFDGFLIASSYPRPILMDKDVTLQERLQEVPKGCSLTDLTNNATRSAIFCRQSVTTYGWHDLQELYASVDVNAITHSIEFRRIGSKFYFVAVLKLEPQMPCDRLDWRYVLLIPEDDIMDEIKRAEMYGIQGAALALLMSILVSVLVAHFFSRRFVKLGQDMSLVAAMQLDGIESEAVNELSYLSEVRTMQISFLRMVDNLREYKRYMPISVLAHSSPDDENDSDTSTKCSTVSFKSHKSLEHSTSNVVLVRSLSMVNVSVLAMKMHINVPNIQSYSTVHKNVMQSVLDIAGNHRGLPVHFFGEHLLISYNALSRCGAKGYHGLKSAVEIRQNATSYGNEARVCMGMSSGLAQCGDVGTDDMKGFSIIGECVEEAWALMRKAGHPTAPSLLVSSQLYSECMSEFPMLCYDLDQSHRVIMEIQETNHLETPQDEWMYAMDDDALRHEFNDAILSLGPAHNNTAAAKAFLEKYEGSNMEGVARLSQKMVRLLDSVRPVEQL
jgi:hypothetical protein